MGDTTRNPLDFTELVFCCISENPGIVANLIVEDFNKPSEWDHPQIEATFYCEQGDFCFSDAYIDIGMPGNVPLNAVLWEPQNAPGKTVLMANHSDGMGFAVQMFPKETDFEWIHILIADHPSLTYPGVHFWYFIRQTSRTIDCIVEDKGWMFVTTGKPLEFEDVRAYKNCDKSKRLTREMVIDYLSHLGYEIDVPEFWIPKQSYRIWQVNRRK
jgi:hypothetical protein